MPEVLPQRPVARASQFAPLVRFHASACIREHIRAGCKVKRSSSLDMFGVDHVGRSLCFRGRSAVAVGHSLPDCRNAANPRLRVYYDHPEQQPRGLRGTRGPDHSLEVLMLRSLAIITAAASLTCLVAGCASGAKVAGTPGPDQEAAMNKLKSLAGEWSKPADGESPASTIVYSVTSGGSAVREIMFPGTGHEMTNLYHLDGTSIICTHYCAMGNQPRMSAKVCACDTANKTCAFTFRDGTNMDPAKDDCMGRQEYTFAGPDTLKVQYHHLGPNGVEKTEGKMPALTLTRVK